MRGVLTRASAAIDRGVVRFMERRMAPRTPRIGPDGEARARLVAVAKAYNDGTLGATSPFFPAPPRPNVRLSPVGDGPLGTQVVDLAFSSDYVPYLAQAREPYARFVENQTAHARWWTSGRGRPTLVLLHGWGGGNHWVTARTFVVPYWLRHGFDVCAFVLPFHGARAPDTGAMSSGALFPSPNPLRTNEAFGHAIFDLRALAMFLRERGSSAVGVMGMSLGGYTASLWASVGEVAPEGLPRAHVPRGPSPAVDLLPRGPAAAVDLLPSVDFAVAMIPAVSMAKLMWRHGEDSPVRRKAAKAGINEDLLADAFAVHAPTTRPATLSRDRLFVIAGRGDRITPPEQAHELAAHWGVDVMWFDGGHLAQVGRSDALRQVRRRLGALDLPGRVFRP